MIGSSLFKPYQVTKAGSSDREVPGKTVLILWPRWDLNVIQNFIKTRELD